MGFKWIKKIVDEEGLKIGIGDKNTYLISLEEGNFCELVHKDLNFDVKFKNEIIYQHPTLSHVLFFIKNKLESLQEEPLKILKEQKNLS